MNSRYYLTRNQAIVNYIVKFFTSRVTDPEKYKRINEVCRSNPLFKHDDPWNLDIKREKNLDEGLLTISDFLYFFLQDEQAPRIDGKYPSSMLLEFTIDVLCECTILIEVKGAFTGYERLFAVNESLTKYIEENEVIDNFVYGFNYILEKYRGSVFKIEVVEGEGGIGTGFLCRFGVDGKNNSFVVTNRHIAEFKIRVVDDNEYQLDVERKFLSDDLDIAVLKLAEDLDRPRFNYYLNPQVLDEVIVIGYPRIPLTRTSYQVAHRGEVNGFVLDYWNKEHLIYSALTNPGNSGGPVVNNLGLVVGVATQQIRMDGDLSVLPYFSATRSLDVVNFLREKVMPAMLI